MQEFPVSFCLFSKYPAEACEQAESILCTCSLSCQVNQFSTVELNFAAHLPFTPPLLALRSWSDIIQLEKISPLYAVLEFKILSCNETEGKFQGQILTFWEI